MPRKKEAEKQEIQEEILEESEKTEELTENMPESKEIIKGKADSEKAPEKKKVSPAEFEKMVVKLADEGLTSEKIGENLRRQGIHPAEFSKRISVILKDAGKYVNPDLKNIEEKLKRVKTHYEKNKKDRRAMRDKDRIFSGMRQTEKYFKVAKK